MWLKSLSNETLALLYELHAGGYHDSKLVNSFITSGKNLFDADGSLLSDTVVMQVTDANRDSIIQELEDLGVLLKLFLTDNSSYEQGDIVIDTYSVTHRVVFSNSTLVKLKRISDGVITTLSPNREILLQIPAFVFGEGVTDENRGILQELGRVYDRFSFHNTTIYVGNFYVGDNSFANDLIKLSNKHETKLQE